MKIVIKTFLMYVKMGMSFQRKIVNVFLTLLAARGLTRKHVNKIQTVFLLAEVGLAVVQSVKFI